MDATPPPTRQLQDMQVDSEFPPLSPSPTAILKKRPTSAIRTSTSKSSKPPPKSPPPIHPSLDSYKFKAVVEISANIPKTDKVYPVLREQILSSLAFIQKFSDPSAAFLPKPNSTHSIPIYDEPSFPMDQFTTGMHFFVYQNEYSLFAIRTENRWVRLSANMGFNIDPSTFLHHMKIDLMGLGAAIEIKQEQSLNTCTNIVFLGAPQFINKAYAKEVMDRHLIPLEKELMAEDSFTYPESIHGGPWPSYSLVLEQPGGLFEPIAKGMKRTPPPRERRALQLLCAVEDYDRLAALIKAGKKRGIWTSEFGHGQCYPVEVPVSDSSKIVKDNYKVMVETHASAQLGMAFETFSGVKDDRVEMNIERLPDLKGPRLPAKISLRHVLSRMQFKGYPVWVCLVRTDKKQGYDIFFDGQCPITTSYVNEFLKCPAAQVMFWLLKRGFVKEQVEAFITATFNLEQLTLCSKARYNSEVKLAQVRTTVEDMDIFTASQRKGSKIHTDLGLTPERILTRQAQLKATVCNLGKFDFSRPQDLRTVRGNASTGAWTEASLGKSIYKVGNDPTDATVGDAEEEESEGEEVQYVPPLEEGHEKQVHFSMDLPGGGISDQLVLPEEREMVTLMLPGLQADGDTEMQGMETAEETPSGIFARSLWLLAPENYRVLFAVLDQLDLEIRKCRNLPLPVVDIPIEVQLLVTDDLRQKLVTGAGGEDFLDFVENMRTMLDELRSADVTAREELLDLYRKRPRDDSDDNGIEEGYRVEDEVDIRNNDGLSADGLPSSSVASSVQMAAAGGTVDPQGSLLSAPLSTQRSVEGDVTTSPSGGGSG